jgi:type IV pilus biogenesis protein CpaD/CtpE
MTELVRKTILAITVLAMVLVSGCTDTTQTADPVSPDNVFVSTSPVIIKEFQEQDLSLSVTNNDTQSIESVTVSDFMPLTVTGTGSINIAGKETTAQSSALNAKITAPAFDTDVNDSTVTVSYLSGMDEEGLQITKTKSLPVDVTVLPDMQLQYLGFVEDMDSLRTTTAENWELKKGENATISFSVKNHGQSTVPAGVLTVVFDVDNELIAEEASMEINESMARSGTSYTKGIQIPVKEDAPNGETDVYVKLMYGDYIVDEQTLILTVKL